MMQQQPITPEKMLWDFKLKIQTQVSQIDYQLQRIKIQEDNAIRELKASLSKPNNATEATEKAKTIAFIRKNKAHLNRTQTHCQNHLQMLTSYSMTVNNASTMQQMQAMMQAMNKMMDPVAIHKMAIGFANESAKAEQIETSMNEAMDNISEAEIESTINTESTNILREVMGQMPTVATNPLATATPVHNDQFANFLANMNVNK